LLQVMVDHGFFAKCSKCSFGQQSIEYLGHIVSGTGVAMDQSKVDFILHWPHPSNLKELRGFLGLTGYYRRFISHYVHIARPLTDLLKRDTFSWNSQAQQAFINWQ
ncbi:hypothetical protein CFOL_v3_28496, partial [Cephalotus follicularis]